MYQKTNTKLIDDVYRSSNNRYKDLYTIFLNNCGFQLLTTSLTLGFDVYRARNCQNINEIKQKDHVKYPPFSPKFSRLGKPNQIWFYLSDHWNACYAEMMPIWYSTVLPGETFKIVISTWQIRQPIRVLIIPDLSNVNEICKQIDLSAYKHDKDFWLYICRMFSTTTLEDSNIYEFTAAFANALMDRAIIEGLELEGIIYPSAQYPEKSNIALKTTSVDMGKIVLRNLRRINFSKSIDKSGLPQYIQGSDQQFGNYDPENDTISWIG